MPNSYMNPEAGLPQDSSNSLPFWNGVQEATRRFGASPFLSNAAASSDLDLQKQQTEQSEFMGPTATAAREAARQVELGKSKNTLETQPLQQQVDTKTLENTIARMPLEQQQKVGELTKQLSEQKGHPAQMFADELANAYDSMKNLPPAVQAQRYSSLVQQHNAQHPDEPVPAGMSNFTTGSGGTMDGAKTIWAAHFNSIAQQQKMAELEKQGQTSKAVAGIQAGGGVEQEKLRAASQERINEASLKAGNPSRQVFDLQKTINSSTASPAEKKQASDMMYDVRSHEAEDQITKELEPMRNRLMFDTTGQAMKDYQKARAIAKIHRMAGYGLKPKVAEVRSLFPSASDADIKASAMKSFGIELE